MKKIFTLLALCLTTLASFAQDAVTELTDGGQYYIAVGNQKLGYITAGDDGATCTIQRASADQIAKQIWTAHQVSGSENTWTFTATVDDATWYMYTAQDNNVNFVYAGTDAGENFQNYVVSFANDDPGNEYASIQILAEIPESGEAFANSYQGQAIGKKISTWTQTDNGSKAYFFEAGSVEVPTWDFNFNTYQAGNNDSRYFIEFSRSASADLGKDKGPLGIEGLTADKLVLSAIGDSLCADSVTAGSDMAGKIWHIVSYNAESHEIKLVNEKGQYIKYVDAFETPLLKGNALFAKNEDGTWKTDENGEYIRTGNSGGGIMNGGFMLTTDEAEATTLYCQASQYGSENYAIGTAADGNNFINAWGNVSWHCFMGKWSVDDQNCALKFVPITEALSTDQIPADPTTGIKTITPATKVANSTVYTLDGRVAGKSLNGLAKGVYIVNGKKVVK